MIMSVAVMTASAGCQFRAVAVVSIYLLSSLSSLFLYLLLSVSCLHFDVFNIENIHFHLEPQYDYLSQNVRSEWIVIVCSRFKRVNNWLFPKLFFSYYLPKKTVYVFLQLTCCRSCNDLLEPQLGVHVPFRQTFIGYVADIFFLPSCAVSCALGILSGWQTIHIHIRSLDMWIGLVPSQYRSTRWIFPPFPDLIKSVNIWKYVNALAIRRTNNKNNKHKKLRC